MLLSTNILIYFIPDTCPKKSVKIYNSSYSGINIIPSVNERLASINESSNTNLTTTTDGDSEHDEKSTYYNLALETNNSDESANYHGNSTNKINGQPCDTPVSCDIFPRETTTVSYDTSPKETTSSEEDRGVLKREQFIESSDNNIFQRIETPILHNDKHFTEIYSNYMTTPSSVNRTQTSNCNHELMDQPLVFSTKQPEHNSQQSNTCIEGSNCNEQILTNRPDEVRGLSSEIHQEEAKPYLLNLQYSDSSDDENT